MKRVRIVVGALGLVMLFAVGLAAPVTASPSANSSCVAKFVNALPAGSRGEVVSFGAQDPALHPFGKNVVSQQAQRHGGSEDPCLVFDTP